ncbi:hypothetical protein K438DRAFT_1902933 [Mycena galopus ATCC 62051]|nr:hypothetical protein K438DRAFT_1902933 [Mycena galopus ATCC 62051]
MADLTQLVPPKDLSATVKQTVFDHFICRLASFRNTAGLYLTLENDLSSLKPQAKASRKEQFDREIQTWAQNLLEQTWRYVQRKALLLWSDSEKDKCPELDPYTDTSTGHLPPLPPPEILSRILNTVLFLHIATSKEYSARTRTFLSTFGSFDEQLIVSALRNPEKAIEETQKQTQVARENHAKRGKTLRYLGVGLGAVAGGVLVGITGGLAAPLVGAAASTVLGILGVGGTAVGLLATGLASSTVICGALFGAYGARTTSNMVQRHTREIRDLAIVPVHKLRKDQETLAVRLCVSGWLTSWDDVVAPWTVFGGDDTFALQWEVELLKSLSNALTSLVKSNTMRYIQFQVLKRTVLASLMTSLLPMAWLKIGQIIDNDWMNSRALAIKAGAVLGDLLANRVFGNRPVTLTGYSLGLVIFEALKYLTTLPPSQTTHLIEDVFLFGTPVPTDPAAWTSIRRLASGRVINGYSEDDYVLGVLSRLSNVSWGVAGLQPVDVMGVENVFCKDVDGHTKWRGMIGKSLQQCGAPGIVDERVDEQMEEAALNTEIELHMTQEEVDEIVKK